MDLVVGMFYIVPTLDEAPFHVVKVKKLSTRDGLEGANVQFWESSTFGDNNQCFIADPWHCNAKQMDGRNWYIHMSFCCLSTECYM